MDDMLFPKIAHRSEDDQLTFAGRLNIMITRRYVSGYLTFAGRWSVVIMIILVRRCVSDSLI
jgi:hypothetical protein